jgi:hypothetical protein
MSKSARRDVNGDLMRMKAPKVPMRIGGGAGMKYGSEASTRWYRQAA